ncbi:MAG: nickel pincer cofactor biosynthesis protein LarB [Candidatus Limnocylindrales bacterium]
MDERRLERLLDAVRDGRLDVPTAVARLRTLPYEDLGFARLDHHRGLRQGLPEVVFCQGKTVPQVIQLVERLAREGSAVLATRASPEMFAAVHAMVPAARHDPLARTIVVPDPQPVTPVPGVLVLTAGTADIPVAQEAAVTAEVMGNLVERVFDVGVAGLHRLLDQQARLRRARVIVVVAGMDGALPSVVGGLVDVPVVAVPTSVGYGASFGGVAALLGMLNACAPGIAVVNIDNGFGAGYLAGLINRGAGASPASGPDAAVPAPATAGG